MSDYHQNIDNAKEEQISIATECTLAQQQPIPLPPPEAGEMTRVTMPFCTCVCF